MFLRTLISAALTLSVLAGGTGVPIGPGGISFADHDSTAAYGRAGNVGAATKVAKVRTTLTLPTAWKVRTKRQVKVRTPAKVRCTTSWKSRKVSGRRTYVALTLTCTVPGDSVGRTVTLTNRKRSSQRLTVTVPTPAPAPAPELAPAPAPKLTPEPTPELAPAPAPAIKTSRAVRDMGRADDYKYLAFQPGDAGIPVTWDRCTPIDVAVNLGAAPVSELNLITAAIDETAAASGLPLRYSGPTALVPSADTASHPYPDGIEIVFAVTDPTATSYLNGQFAGYGGMFLAGGAGPPDLPNLWAFRGMVVIDWAVTNHASTNYPDPGQLRAGVYLHELGHAVGMGHAAEPEQLMYPRIGPSNYLGWGAGDQAGLGGLGARACRSTP